MNIEEQRLNYINTSMDLIHDLCDDLYEALIDEDFGAIELILFNIEDALRDINETFKDEI
jgi:hypothetical protein